MSINWRHIRRELLERKKAQGLTADEEKVLAEAEAAIKRDEPWMSWSGPDRAAPPS